MKGKKLIVGLFLLIAFKSVSQIYIETDSVSFDFETAKKIEWDLIELKDYRDKEPIQLNQIRYLLKMLQLKDSLLTNKDKELELSRRISSIELKQEKSKPKEKGWVKWIFGVLGLIFGISLF